MSGDAPRVRRPDPGALERAVWEAQTHFWIGAETGDANLPVDWRYVAEQMFESLRAALPPPGTPDGSAVEWAPHLEAHAELYPEEDDPAAYHEGDRLDFIETRDGDADWRCPTCGREDGDETCWHGWPYTTSSCPDRTGTF